MKAGRRKLSGSRWSGTAAYRVAALFGILLALVLPLWLPEYLQSLATAIVAYSLLAVSLDLILGYAGLVSLGHAAFFGIGGYAAGIAMVRYGVTDAWFQIPLAVAAASLGAALAGLVALRVSGIYFLLVTFALGQLAYSVALKWSYLTNGGAEGIASINYPHLPGIVWTTGSFYDFSLLVLVAVLVVFLRLIHSPFGAALRGIKENPMRMSALGYNIWLYKYIAFVIAGAAAGLAGALFAYQSGIIAPADMGITVSALALFMVLIGGAGTLYGPVIGAILLTVLQYFGSVFYPDRWQLLLGVVFVATIMFARRGVGVVAVNACVAAWHHIRR